MKSSHKRRLERLEAAARARSVPEHAEPGSTRATTLSEEAALVLKMEFLGIPPARIRAGALKGQGSKLARELTDAKAAELLARCGTATLREARDAETSVRTFLGLPTSDAELARRMGLREGAIPAITPAYRRALARLPKTAGETGRGEGACPRRS